MGLERLLLVMEQQGCGFAPEQKCTMYIGSIGDAAQQKAAGLTAALREEGFYVECDAVGRSVKAQMKYADKLGAKFSCILRPARYGSSGWIKGRLPKSPSIRKRWCNTSTITQLTK